MKRKVKEKTIKERMPEVVRDMKADYANGFRFVIYVSQYRGRRFIAEISGIKRVETNPISINPLSVAGFSWMAYDTKQRKMRWLEQCLLQAQIPIRYKT